MTNSLPVLQSHPDCVECELHQYATCRGMATRIADCGGKGHRKAVLLIGKAPGVE